jgi:hypothetical protein
MEILGRVRDQEFGMSAQNSCKQQVEIVQEKTCGLKLTGPYGLGSLSVLELIPYYHMFWLLNMELKDSAFSLLGLVLI